MESGVLKALGFLGDKLVEAEDSKKYVMGRLSEQEAENFKLRKENQQLVKKVEELEEELETVMKELVKD
jgi:cell division protein FtsB